MSGEPRSKKLKTQIALSALCQELQGNVSSLSSTDQQANTGAISSRSGLLFQRLLELNRTATAGTRNTKKTLSESKGALDAASLRLQNLQYERLHLEREIAATETFATIYQQIPLISETEFEAEAPESLRMAIPSKDPHQFMLNRLTYELEERKRLAETVKTLQDRKAAMEKGNKALIQDFTKLDSEIETLLTVLGVSDTFKTTEF